MKTIQYLLLAIILLLTSCTEDKVGSCRVNIRLLPPENYAALSLEQFTVTLTNQSHGASYKSRCSADGFASFNVEYGYYTVSAYCQTVSGLIFSGRIENISLLPGEADIPDRIELQLNRSETNALVIKEIYYAGCIGRLGEEYQSDQYVTLYNNSNETIYLDSLCIAIVDPAGSVESPWMKYTDMNRIPVNDLAWQFPGTGKDHPLAPGAETTVATNAVNHTGGEYQHSNSIDLSGVDWGFWDLSLKRQDIQAGVTPLKLISKLNPNTTMYSFPTMNPTLIVFKLQNISAEEYVNNPDNREIRPQSIPQSRQYLMIPKEWVIDCVECVSDVGQVTNKRVPNELNHTPAYISEGTYSGKSLVRKKMVEAEGRVVYQDTNNASDDFEVTTPLLKN